jgi:polyisoprenoid-binding protein YceI
MKQLFYSIGLLCLAVSCSNAPEADKATTTDKQEVKAAEGTSYSTDSSSVVTWTGTKPTGTHVGTFRLKEGSLTVNDNNLTGGTITIDINSLVNQDLPAEEKPKLEGHLKSPDFFDVAKFPHRYLCNY